MVKRTWGFSFLLHGLIILALVLTISRSSPTHEEGVAFQNAPSIQAFALTPIRAQPHSASHPLKTFPKTTLGVYTAASETHQSQAQETAGPSHQDIPLAPKAMQALLDQIAQFLQAHLIYPQQAELNQEAGTAVVQFVLQPSGRVVDAQVIHSSGYADLDQAALDTLQAIEPVVLSIPIVQPLALQVPMVFEQN